MDSGIWRGTLASPFRLNSLASFWQGKNEERRGGLRKMASAFRPQSRDKILCGRASTGRKGYILPPAHGKTDWRRGDAAPGVEGPELLASPGIERECIALQIPAENQIPRRCQQRRNIEVFCVKRPLPLAGRGIERADVWRNCRVHHTLIRMVPAFQIRAVLEISCIPPACVRTVG